VSPSLAGWLLLLRLWPEACLGEVQWSFGVFFKALENEFGWTRGLTSSGFTFLAVGLGLSSIAYGWLTDRYSPRPVLLGAALVTGISMVLCSRIESLIQLQLLLFATGVGAGGVVPVCTATVARWFVNHSGGGIALGSTIAGVGVGATAFAPLFGALISAAGWRTCFLIAGLVFFAMVFLAALALKPGARRSCNRAARDAAL
jgi:MFS family permease